MNWRKIISHDNLNLLLSNVMASVFGVLIFMILARELSDSEFGQYVMFLSAAGLFDLLRTGLVRQGFVHLFQTQTSNAFSAIITSGWQLHSLIVLGLSMILFPGFWLIKTLNPDWQSLQLFLLYYPIYMIASYPHQMASWIAQAYKEYQLVNRFRMVTNILYITWIVMMGVLGKSSLTQAMLGLVLSNAVVSIYPLWKLNYKNLMIWQKDLILKLFHFGKYSLGTLAGANLLKSADLLLIGSFLGPEKAAIYAVPLKTLELIEIPMRGFLMTSYSSLIKCFHAGNLFTHAKMIISSLLRLMMIVLPVAAVCSIFPKLVITILGGQVHDESVTILWILCAAMLIMPLDKILGVSLDSMAQPHRNASKVWIMVFLNLIGDVVALYFFQSLWAVAMVTVLNLTGGILFGMWGIQHFRQYLPVLFKLYLQKSKGIYQKSNGHLTSW